jgi:hypothetical protein
VGTAEENLGKSFTLNDMKKLLTLTEREEKLHKVFESIELLEK